MFNDVYFLTKNNGNFEVMLENFIAKLNVNYKGKYSDPSVFYTAAGNGHNNIVILDYNSFGEESKIISEMLYSLQTILSCKVIVSSSIPHGIDLPFVYIEGDPNIQDKFVKISNAIIKIIKATQTQLKK